MSTILTITEEENGGAVEHATNTLPAGLRELRLGCQLPHPEDGTSYHRSWGPLSAMRREDSRLQLVLPRRGDDGKGWYLGWDWCAGCDVILMQRPAFPWHVQFAKQVKGMGLPLWMEWDDDYTCLPVSNPHYPEYGNVEEIKRILRELCHLADVITVATPELARRIPRSQQGKVTMIPNACMPVYQASKGRSPAGLKYAPWFNEPRQKRVSWRGTDTHDEDLMTILPAMGEVSRLPQFANWLWHFSGGMPWEAHEHLGKERLEMSPFAGPVFFVPLLSILAPFVHLVPLKRNAFNLCKSNLAWLEATAAGAVVLAPELEEWKRPGIVNYRDSKEFGQKLRMLLESFKPSGKDEEGQPVGEMHPLVQESREYIEKNLLLHQVNAVRWEVLRKLL